MAPIHHHFEMLNWSETEDHRPLLDHRGDVRRGGLRPVLPAVQPVHLTGGAGAARREACAVASDRDLDAARVLVVGRGPLGHRRGRRAAPRAARGAVRLVDRDGCPTSCRPASSGVLGETIPSSPTAATSSSRAPACPASSPVVAAARAAGLPDLERGRAGLRLLGPEHPWIGITGTNGKSTATSLTGAMLEAGGVPCAVAGNIGDAVSGLVGELARGRLGRLRAVELPARGRRRAAPARRRAAERDARPPRPARLARGVRRGEAAHVRATGRRTTSRCSTTTIPWIAALSDDVPGPGAARARARRLADAPADLLDAFGESALAGSHNLENALCAAAAAEAAGAERAGVLDGAARPSGRSPHRHGARRRARAASPTSTTRRRRTRRRRSARSGRSRTAST